MELSVLSKSRKKRKKEERGRKLEQEKIATLGHFKRRQIL
jgi:hypothetical protein